MNSTTHLHRRGHRHPRPPPRPPAGRARPPGHRHHPLAGRRAARAGRRARGRRPARRRAPCARRSCAARAGRRRAPAHRARRARHDAATSTRRSPSTNRLRTEGTDHLIAAARAAGARRLVWQSFAGWPYAREGAPVKTEDDPLDPEPPADARETLAAIRHLETRGDCAPGSRASCSATAASTGPTTSIDAGGEHSELVRKRQFPIGGDGPACGRSCTSTTRRPRPSRRSRAARPGIYNVVDDDPAPTREWLPALREQLGAPAAAAAAGLAHPPRRAARRRFADDPRPRRVERQGRPRPRLAPRRTRWREGFAS